MPVHDSINLFGGFAPFPNTVMVPVMGLQSDVIGFRFGFGYEKGKRTLRAMSNEEFNAMDEKEEAAIYKRHETTAINFFELELNTWVELQKIIIEKSVEIETMKAQRTPSATAEVISHFYSGVSKMGEEAAKTISWNQLAKIIFGPIISLFIPDSPRETPENIARTPAQEIDPRPQQQIDVENRINKSKKEIENQKITDARLLKRWNEAQAELAAAAEKRVGESRARQFDFLLKEISFSFTWTASNGKQGIIKFTEQHNKAQWIKVLKYWESLSSNNYVTNMKSRLRQEIVNLYGPI